MVEFFLVEISGQGGALDEQLGPGEHLGGVAVTDALEARDDDRALRPDVEDVEAAAVFRKERTVAVECQWITGKGLDAQLALDAVRGADHSHQDGVLELCHRASV